MESNLPAPRFVPPPRRNAWWALKHLWFNFLGCWPLVLLLVFGVVTSIPLALVSIDNLGKRWSYFTFRLWAKAVLKAFGVRVWVKGLENIDPSRRYIVTPNHRSHLDVLSLGATIPIVLVSVHKKVLEYVPLLGQALWISRSVGLHRDDAKDSHRRLKVIAQRLATGRSVVIFPEGHRSRGPKLDVFKKGAAVLAAEQAAPILPLTISGADVLYPPGSLMIHRGDVLVEIHRPIETAGMTSADREAIIKQVRASVDSTFAPGPLDLERVKGATRAC